MCAGESVFKASVQRRETLEAEDVQESRGEYIPGIADLIVCNWHLSLTETKVERPVDQVEAQEVEEVVEEEGEEGEKWEGGKRASEHVEDSAQQVITLLIIVHVLYTCKQG